MLDQLQALAAEHPEANIAQQVGVLSLLRGVSEAL